MITTVNSSASLLDALKVAQDGDTILLAAGAYDAVTLSGFHFASGVTIASADPAHQAALSNLTVTGSSGLSFQHLNVSTVTGTAATVTGSSNISFSQDTFTGSTAGVGNAMLLRNSSNITVTGSDFGTLGTGINALTDSGLSITGNTFHGITGGAVRGTAVTTSTISGNTFTDASSAVANHSDVINLWQDNTANQVTIGSNFYGPPLPGVISSTQQLMEALQNAHAGDVIKLAAGVYDAVTISNFQFDSAVTITSADPTHQAVFSNLTVSHSSGLTFEGVALTTATGTAASVAGSHGVTFSQDTFSGSAAGSGNAVMLRGSDHITITGSDFGKLGTGINALTDSNVTITNNDFHDISGGAIRGTAVTSSTISGNTFADASSTVANHQDVIYLWQDNTANNVSITDNAFGSAAHVVEVDSTQQLLTALKSAHAGDVIELAAGTYSSVAINNVNFDGAVTIASADPTHHAVLSNLIVSGSSGLNFEQLDLTTATGTAATVSSSHGVTFSDDAFSGAAEGAGSAMMLRGSDTITVTGSDFTKLGAGVNLLTDNNITVTNNDFHGVSGQDVRGTGVTWSTISGNTFADASSTVANHQDVVYLWQDNIANHVTIGPNVYGTGATATLSSTPSTSSVTSVSSTTPTLSTTSSSTVSVSTPSTSGPQTVTVSNTDQLVAALKTAHGGDVIKLAAGAYSAAALNNLHFDQGAVTITSAGSTEAVFNGLVVSNSSGLVLDHLDVALPTVASGVAYAVSVNNSANIALSNLTVEGPAGGVSGDGLYVRNATGVSITHSEFADLGVGVSELDNSNITISNNSFHDIAVDGIDNGGSSQVVVSSNTFTDFHPTALQHPDAIQFFAGSTGAQGSNILVEDNVITRGAGEPMQGIFVENTNHIEITGNAMSGTMYNGIGISTTADALITDNFVQGYTDMGTRIITRGASSDVSVIGNTSEAIIDYQPNGVINPNYVESGNTTIGAATIGDLSAMNAWLSHHVASTASLTDLFFLH